jgi:hypothetical protein
MKPYAWWEGPHSIKTRKHPMFAIKIDLSKEYDHVLWLSLWLLLLHIGFDIPLIKWIMSCVSFVSFVVLISGVGSSFFKSSQGLCKGCPLSPYLFLLMVDGLSCVVEEYKRVHIF